MCLFSSSGKEWVKFYCLFELQRLLLNNLKTRTEKKKMIISEFRNLLLINLGWQPLANFLTTCLKVAKRHFLIGSSIWFPDTYTQRKSVLKIIVC